MFTIRTHRLLCTGGRYASPNQLLVGQVRKAGITGRRARALRAFFNDSWQDSRTVLARKLQDSKGGINGRPL